MGRDQLGACCPNGGTRSPLARRSLGEGGERVAKIGAPKALTMSPLRCDRLLASPSERPIHLHARREANSLNFQCAIQRHPPTANQSDATAQLIQATSPSSSLPLHLRISKNSAAGRISHQFSRRNSPDIHNAIRRIRAAHETKGGRSSGER